MLGVDHCGAVDKYQAARVRTLEALYLVGDSGHVFGIVDVVFKKDKVIATDQVLHRVDGTGKEIVKTDNDVFFFQQLVRKFAAGHAGSTTYDIQIFLHVKPLFKFLKSDDPCRTHLPRPYKVPVPPRYRTERIHARIPSFRYQGSRTVRKD